jgi:hypothetical protein
MTLSTLPATKGSGCETGSNLRLRAGEGLKLSREKTRIVNLGQEGAVLDFFGVTFCPDRGLYIDWNGYLSSGDKASAASKISEANRASSIDEASR